GAYADAPSCERVSHAAHRRSRGRAKVRRRGPVGDEAAQLGADRAGAVAPGLYGGTVGVAQPDCTGLRNLVRRCREWPVAADAARLLVRVRQHSGLPVHSLALVLPAADLVPLPVASV